MTTTAWELVGFPRDAEEDRALVRIVGGRTLYESVEFRDDGRSRRVRLARLDVTAAGLRQVNRYVDPDTRLEVVPVDG